MMEWLLGDKCSPMEMKNDSLQSPQLIYPSISNDSDGYICVSLPVLSDASCSLYISPIYKPLSIQPFPVYFLIHQSTDDRVQWRRGLVVIQVGKRGVVGPFIQGGVL